MTREVFAGGPASRVTATVTAGAFRRLDEHVRIV